MNKSDFLRQLQEIMQLDYELNGDEILDSIDEWDSLTVLSLLSVFEFKIEDIRSAKTVHDIINLLR
jgi:hypothetical protein